MDSIWKRIHAAHPLIHAITNPVTMNDVVNVILAAGGSAICADSPDEAAEITAISQGLLLNIGMPGESRRRAMILAGKAANRKGIPVVLDPVGAGASGYRRKILSELLREVHFSCIRANMSEAAALLGIAFPSEGVEDAGVILTREQMRQLAKQYQTIVAITGETDYIISPDHFFVSHTGTPKLKTITGAGCMLSGLTAACLAAVCPAAPAVKNRSGPPEEAVAAVYSLLNGFGLSAQNAEASMRERGLKGTAGFRAELLNEISIQSGIWD